MFSIKAFVHLFLLKLGHQRFTQLNTFSSRIHLHAECVIFTRVLLESHSTLHMARLFSVCVCVALWKGACGDGLRGLLCQVWPIPLK